jgi:type IV pilus assembly protein PilV
MDKQNGFTLIEVLIAMLVLAIGLLGLAGLQATSLRNTQSAYNRSLATELAYDLADRMRANISGVAAYTTSSAAQNANCENTSGCSSSQMAQNDLYEWNAVITTLPSGQGIICFDSTPNDGTSLAPMCDGVGSTYVIKIWWDDNHDGVTDLSFVTSFQL